MAEITKVIRIGDTLTNLIDSNTKESVNYKKVTNYYDNTPMTDLKVDGELYRKSGSEYFRKIISKEGELFLEKDTMAQMRALTNYEILLLKSGIVKGVRLNGYYLKNDTPNSIEYYISDTILSDDGGAIIEINNVKFEHKFKFINSFLYYGIKGNDSTIDDGLGIKKLFTYASNNKVDVFNNTGEYYLKEIRGIPIKVNVDFGKSIFHIYEEFDNSLNGRFDILPDSNPVDVVLPNGFIELINSGETYIDFLKNFKNYYFIIENTNQYINRNGGSGGKQYFNEMFFISDNGTIMTEITGKLNGWTSCKAYPVPNDFTNIKGGVFKLNCKTSTSGYKLSGFNCTRSRVTISEQIVTYEDGVNYADNLSPDLGFHYFIRTYDSKVVNTQSISRANEGGSGTYGLGVRYATKVLLDNVSTAYGENAWGYMGGYIVKDLIVKDSSISRIDVHFSGHNVSIDNCFVNLIALSGSGTLKINDTTVRGNAYLPFRQDYGSIWDGDIIINNGKLINNTNLRARVLNYQYDDFDFGQNQNLSLCKSLKIDGFTYIHKNATQVRLNVFDILSNKMVTIGNNRVKFPTYVELKNMRSVGNDGFCPLSLENISGAYVENIGGLIDGVLKTNSLFIVDSVDISNTYNTINHQNSITQTEINELYPKFEFKNCKNVKINTAAILAEHTFLNCSINAYRSINPNSSQTFTECNLEWDRIGTISNAVNAISNRTRYINCVWDTPRLNGIKVTVLSDINTILGTVSGLQFGSPNTEAIYKVHINSTLSSDLISKLTALSVAPSVFMNRRLNINTLSDPVTVYRTYGTTAQRPTVTIVDFKYYNTQTGSLDVWNGSSWGAVVPNATSSLKGVVNQSTSSTDSATEPSATYTQAEVQAILTELRDLKTKLRTAGILAT